MSNQQILKMLVQHLPPIISWFIRNPQPFALKQHSAYKVDSRPWTNASQNTPIQQWNQWCEGKEATHSTKISVKALNTLLTENKHGIWQCSTRMLVLCSTKIPISLRFHVSFSNGKKNQIPTSCQISRRWTFPGRPPQEKSLKTPTF